MAQLDLTAIPTTETVIDPALISYNFERIGIVSEILKDVSQETLSVTGTVTLSTLLSSVEGVVVSLASTPVAGAAFVSAFIVPNSGQITINVWTSAFAVSTTPVNVTYIAIGVMTL